jgi:biopolymer transport protein ExbD
MALSSRNKVSVAFSMSGMTDIVFLLLIFFMLTSTLIAPNAIKLLLPQSSNQTPAKPQVSISITENLEYYVNSRQVQFSELEAALDKELRFRAEPTISLHADKRIAFDHVVQVMNIAKNKKYKIIVATSPE